MYNLQNFHKDGELLLWKHPLYKIDVEVVNPNSMDPGSSPGNIWIWYRAPNWANKRCRSEAEVIESIFAIIENNPSLQNRNDSE